MNRYRIILRKPFESMGKFEKRLNAGCGRDSNVINLTGAGPQLAVLLGRENKH